MKNFRLYSKNVIKVAGDIAVMDLYNQQGKIVAKTKFDSKFIDKVKRYKWHLHSTGYARNRRIGYLHNYLLNRNTTNRKITPDHLNRDKLNNLLSNLKIDDDSQNKYNRGLQSNNTSGYPGINYIKRLGKWRARIKFQYKEIHLGVFDNKNEAIEARKQAEKQYIR